MSITMRSTVSITAGAGLCIRLCIRLGCHCGAGRSTILDPDASCDRRRGRVGGRDGGVAIIGRAALAVRISMGVAMRIGLAAVGRSLRFARLGSGLAGSLGFFCSRSSGPGLLGCIGIDSFSVRSFRICSLSICSLRIRHRCVSGCSLGL